MLLPSNILFPWQLWQTWWYNCSWSPDCCKPSKGGSVYKNREMCTICNLKGAWTASHFTKEDLWEEPVRLTKKTIIGTIPCGSTSLAQWNPTRDPARPRARSPGFAEPHLKLPKWKQLPKTDRSGGRKRKWGHHNMLSEFLIKKQDQQFVCLHTYLVS